MTYPEIDVLLRMLNVRGFAWIVLFERISRLARRAQRAEEKLAAAERTAASAMKLLREVRSPHRWTIGTEDGEVVCLFCASSAADPRRYCPGDPLDFHAADVQDPPGDRPRLQGGG